MQTSRDGIIENFDRGNAEGAALSRQTDQSRAAGAHTLIRSRRIGKAPGREVNSFRSRYSVRPLEYMLKFINNDKLPMQLRCDMAKAALPF
jgi:hypothetical protein